MSQASHPTFINLPPPSSNPDTPSEMPGTPTSTTTSLSALSTTAIKDGQRGSAHHAAGRGHHHNPSTTSLEAERADRISRLAGLSNVQNLRVPSGGIPQGQSGAQFHSPQTTPTSTGMPPFAGANAVGGYGAQGGGVMTPPAAYFDAAGQPVAATKMSTVGTASATDSLGARTLGDDSGTTGGAADHDMMMGDDSGERDEDLMSMDTNYRGTDSASGYMGTIPGAEGDMDAMDEDLANRSVGGYEDRLSDDGTGSLVGFGEGAGSTLSGPIYHRRPLPGQAPGSSASAMGNVWTLERSSSGLSEGAFAGARRERLERERESAAMGSGGSGGSGADALVSGPMADGSGTPRSGGADDVFVDSARGGLLAAHVQPTISSIRETQQPHSFQQQQQQGQQQAAASREAVERMLREKNAQQDGGLQNFASTGH